MLLPKSRQNVTNSSTMRKSPSVISVSVRTWSRCLFWREGFRGFFVLRHDDRSDRKSANPMRLLSKPAGIGLKSFKIMDFAVVCSGLGFHRPGNIR